MNVFIGANFKKSRTESVYQQVLKRLDSYGIVYCTGSPEKIADCDVVLTIGGDGTILNWGKIAAIQNKPLLGINTGRLGFMATLEYHELEKLERLREKRYRISNRMMLEVTYASERYTALNDVVFHKGAAQKLPSLMLVSNGVEVLKIRADGIILSTATGSTAYALSAGGPIIEPECQCIEFTPLCAHTLFARPMIFAGDDRLTFRYDGESVVMCVDGEREIQVMPKTEVQISRSALSLQLIDFEGNSFYSAVHNKLMRPLK